MKTETPNLTPNQEAALTALMATLTAKQAAEKCNLSETTLWCMMREPAFSAAYADARRKAMEQALAVLQKGSAGAVGCLLEVMQDKDAPASVRLSAARSVLEYSFKGVELLETEARLAALEEALNTPEGKGKTRE